MRKALFGTIGWLLGLSAAAAQSVWVGDFINSIGVNIHASQGYAPSNYITMLNYLGIKSVRDGANRGNYTPYLQIAQGSGVKFDIFVNNIAQGLQTAHGLAAAGALLAIEGPNEPNNFPLTYNGQTCGKGATSWMPCAQFQSALYAAVKADAALQSYPVFSISEVGAEPDNVGLQWAQIPSPTPSGVLMPGGTVFADYNNDHNYVVGNCAHMVDNFAWGAAGFNTFNCVDGWASEQVQTWARKFAGYAIGDATALPKVTTETSWGTVGSGAVTEQKQASVALDVFLSQFVRGWSYTFWYELRDGEGGDTAGMGLFHSDYSPKPAATALRILLTIFADNGARPPLGSFSYSVQTSALTVHNQMFQKSDGSFWLVVWDERATASDSVQITFGGQSRNYNLYDPTQASTPIGAGLAVLGLQVTLSDHPVIIQIL
jgi:hypothetical protein